MFKLLGLFNYFKQFTIKQTKLFGPVRVGARSELGPIWALMGPPGQVFAGPDMSDFRLLVQFRTFRVQNKVFDKIYK